MRPADGSQLQFPVSHIYLTYLSAEDVCGGADGAFVPSLFLTVVYNLKVNERDY